MNPQAQLVTWVRNQNVVRRNLRRALESLELNGNELTIPKERQYDAATTVLSGCVSLLDVQHDSARWEIICLAVQDLKRTNGETLGDFRKSLTRLLEQRNQVAATTHYVVFPLNLPTVWLPQATVLSCNARRFLPTTWGKLARRFDVAAWQQDVRMNGAREIKIPDDRFLPLIAVLSARSSREAFETTEEPFECLRAILNLSAQFGRLILMSGLPRPFGPILAPPTYGIFTADRAFSSCYLNTDPARRYERNPIPEIDAKLVKRVLRRWARTPPVNELRALLADAVRRYGHAMDCADWREAFLALWQALEMITIVRRDGNFRLDEVCRRTAALLGGSEQIADLMDTLRVTRNEFVHRGMFSANGLRVVNLLKGIVELCFESLDGLSDRFNTRVELDEFYRLAVLQRVELTDRSKAMNYLLSWYKRQGQA